MQQSIRVRPAQDSDIVDTIRLIQMQAMRIERERALPFALQNSTYVRERLKQQQSEGRALVAVNERDDVRGYVSPSLWILSEKSILHAFLTERNGIASTLTLPDPREEDARAVAAALFQALTIFWREQGTTGDLIRWPSRDTWLQAILAEHGFLLDSICALRPPTPPEERWMAQFEYVIRAAVPADEEAVVALFQEELAFHEKLGLFGRVSPFAIEAFRAKLAACWSRTDPHVDGTFVLVVEAGMGIVAMAECTLLNITADDEPGFTPPGRYGSIDHMSISVSARGQGIGGALTARALRDMQQWWQPEGYLLWYSADNPLSAPFWNRRGFEPLWTTYQRLKSPE
jgi:GNAT superfamily N-acetyltransferase